MKYLFLRDNAGKHFSVHQKLLYILLAVFFVTFYLPSAPVINNISIGLILILSFYHYNTIKDKLRLLRQRPAILLIIIFYILHIISTLASQNKEEAVSMLLLRIPLLIFPVSIGLLYLPTELKDRIFLLYAVTATLAAIICLTSALFVYQQKHDTGFLYNDSLSDVINKQSVYVALLMSIAIFSYVYLLLKYAVSKGYKILATFILIFLLVFHFMLASRMEISFLYTSALLFTIYYFYRRKKIWQGTALIAGILLAGVIFVALFPKTINRFRELQYPEYNISSKAIESHYNMQLTPEQWNGISIRLAIWECSWELAKQHLLLGIPLGDKKEALMNKYKEKEFYFGMRTKKNTHSNYLDVLITFGIFGLVFFIIAFLVLPFRSCILEKDILGGFIVAAFSCSLITETYIDRSMGCVWLAFFISLILSNKGEQQIPVGNQHQRI